MFFALFDLAARMQAFVRFFGSNPAELFDYGIFNLTTFVSAAAYFVEIDLN